MNVTLDRLSHQADATLGWLTLGVERIATLEEPWRPEAYQFSGQRVQSCVPEGTYRLVRHDGAHWKDTWALVNPQLRVYHQQADIPPGEVAHFAVLIHAGNSLADTEACILVGLRHGRELDKPWIYKSQDALARVRSILGNEEHTLEIRRAEAAQEAAA